MLTQDVLLITGHGRQSQEAFCDLRKCFSIARLVFRAQATSLAITGRILGLHYLRWQAMSFAHRTLLPSAECPFNYGTHFAITENGLQAQDNVRTEYYVVWSLNMSREYKIRRPLTWYVVWMAGMYCIRWTCVSRTGQVFRSQDTSCDHKTWAAIIGHGLRSQNMLSDQKTYVSIKRLVLWAQDMTFHCWTWLAITGHGFKQNKTCSAVILLCMGLGVNMESSGASQYARMSEGGRLCVPACLSIPESCCLFVWLTVCLFVCLRARPWILLFSLQYVCLPVWFPACLPVLASPVRYALELMLTFLQWCEDLHQSTHVIVFVVKPNELECAAPIIVAIIS